MKNLFLFGKMFIKCTGQPFENFEGYYWRIEHNHSQLSWPNEDIYEISHQRQSMIDHAQLLPHTGFSESRHFKNDYQANRFERTSDTPWGVDPLTSSGNSTHSKESFRSRSPLQKYVFDSSDSTCSEENKAQEHINYDRIDHCSRRRLKPTKRTYQTNLIYVGKNKYTETNNFITVLNNIIDDYRKYGFEVIGRVTIDSIDNNKLTQNDAVKLLKDDGILPFNITCEEQQSLCVLIVLDKEKYYPDIYRKLKSIVLKAVTPVRFIYIKQRTDELAFKNSVLQKVKSNYDFRKFMRFSHPYLKYFFDDSQYWYELNRDFKSFDKVFKLDFAVTECFKNARLAPYPDNFDDYLTNGWFTQFPFFLPLFSCRLYKTVQKDCKYDFLINLLKKSDEEYKNEPNHCYYNGGCYERSYLQYLKNKLECISYRSRILKGFEVLYFNLRSIKERSDSEEYKNLSKKFEEGNYDDDFLKAFSLKYYELFDEWYREKKTRFAGTRIEL